MAAVLLGLVWAVAMWGVLPRVWDLMHGTDPSGAAVAQAPSPAALEPTGVTFSTLLLGLACRTEAISHN